MSPRILRQRADRVHGRAAVAARMQVAARAGDDDLGRRQCPAAAWRWPACPCPTARCRRPARGRPSPPCRAWRGTPGSDGEPHSSSPSSSTLTATGQAPGHALPGPHRLEEGHELALVVLRAARDDHLAVDLVGGEARLERRRSSTARADRAAARRSGRRTARAGRRFGRCAPWSCPTTIGWPVVATTRASKPMLAQLARAPLRRLAGIAACRRDRSRRWGCGSARTAARAPASCVASSVFKTLGRWARIGHRGDSIGSGERGRHSGQPCPPVNRTALSADATYASFFCAA